MSLKVLLNRIHAKIRGGLYRRELGYCASTVQFYGKVYFTCGDTITIGEDCRINNGVEIYGQHGCKIRIGNRVTISPGVIILASGYDTDLLMKLGRKEHMECETVIGDDVWLCTRCIVTAGVHITGHHVIVAAGAVVTNDITDDYCLYGGIPARKIKDYKVE